MDEKRFHIVVYGRVQGVGFRYFTSETAQEMGLSGWVRNMPDRNVEIEIQGAGERIDQFCTIVRDGPPLGHVTNMDIQPRPVKSGESGFHIRH